MSGECEQFAVDLSAYFDGELPPDEAAAVKAHVDGCARCRADLNKMRGLRAALQRTGAAAAPEKRLIQDLMRTLQRPEGQDGGRLGDGIGRGPAFTRGR